MVTAGKNNSRLQVESSP